MTVKELIELLRGYPEDMTVKLYDHETPWEANHLDIHGEFRIIRGDLVIT